MSPEKDCYYGSIYENNVLINLYSDIFQSILFQECLLVIQTEPQKSLFCTRLFVNY